MSKIKAVIFDYDGTIRDSLGAVYAAYDHAFEANGLAAPTKEALAPHIHHHTFVHKALAPDISWEAFEREYRDKVDALLVNAELFPEVRSTLASLHDEGYKIALVTAAKFAQKYLAITGIDHLFNVVVSAEDLTKHKPDPEGMNIALQRLGAKPGEAVYVGDMVTDVQAAHAANVRCVGVTYGFATREELEQAAADAIISSIDGLPAVLRQFA